MCIFIVLENKKNISNVDDKCQITIIIINAQMPNVCSVKIKQGNIFLIYTQYNITNNSVIGRHIL